MIYNNLLPRFQRSRRPVRRFVATGRADFPLMSVWTVQATEVVTIDEPPSWFVVPSQTFFTLAA